MTETSCLLPPLLPEKKLWPSSFQDLMPKCTAFLRTDASAKSHCSLFCTFGISVNQVVLETGFNAKAQ